MNREHSSDLNQHDRIESYLRSTLSDHEQTEFELEMFEDPELAREVSFHQALKEQLKQTPLNQWSNISVEKTKSRWWNPQNIGSSLAWLITGGCTAILFLTILPEHPQPAAFSVTDEIALHSFRGEAPSVFQGALSSRAAGANVLLSVDTVHAKSLTELSLTALSLIHI